MVDTEMSFPEPEDALVREAYRAARVILEYGSGGSTWFGSGLPGKLIFSVESDRDWALDMQQRIDAADLPSPAILHHVDIGPTGAWGRPLDDRAWDRFHRYPAAIWDAPFFRHPDLILIDGRFRPACLAHACLRIARPVRVLFDDYVTRPAYHRVERFVEPVARAGRMAEFRLTPGMIGPELTGEVLEMFATATYARKGAARYDAPAADPAANAPAADPAANAPAADPAANAPAVDPAARPAADNPAPPR